MNIEKLREEFKKEMNKVKNGEEITEKFEQLRRELRDLEIKEYGQASEEEIPF
ncbi:hypothetical protein HYH70_11115 [Clostridium botulinum]|uniref:hypothetical protein n=1 Tax=Clostridium botulinum TaxID=1491 RepID=UPI00035BA886|nr:hypothetical protein [Clostridium botulinum]EPS48457.1 hypothetical protein CFSAN002367_20177 [Clostridium botulinum CFSAN002367]MBY6795172.1 hypothetical protein [Clostridium botulinum]MBY6865894.1 hypothetical protein [Clostridium botulinum]MBY6906165.1 hypothetical protein [Clostridium botulinum]MBY6927617.1 hypothetical protein [Clostridium botulinum]